MLFADFVDLMFGFTHSVDSQCRCGYPGDSAKLV